MSADRWERLSEWHNAWLEADAASRARLEAQLAGDASDIAADAWNLAAASGAAADFLDTPAMVVAAVDLSGLDRELAPGTAIGPYRIGSLLARGGMGDVYRATDVRLGRDVALKILHASSATDPQRVERFLQEARVTAALENLNIVRVHDVGVSGGRPYLVEELLEGETLAQRIARGPLAIPEAIRIAQEIAKGLAAVHAAGVVHRDVKPDNVFLTRTGAAKVLDFGIAKLAQDDVPRGAVATLSGILLGTVGYVAPEQVRGEAVDGRADLFALGSMLFEMLSGTRAFAREHTVDTLYAIVHETPPDLLQLRGDVPPALAAVVSRLREKSPAARFQSALDLEWTLDQIDGRPTRAAGHQAPRGIARPAWWWGAVAALVGAIVVATLVWRGSGPGEAGAVASATRLTQFSWTLPEGLFLLSPPMISPDGRRIAFVALDGDVQRLRVRDLADTRATAVAGTEGARHPFWSPDGTALAFFARGKLMRVTLPDGAPVEIADAPDPRGGAWGASGTIVFQATFRDAGLSRVRASGGPVEPATILDMAGGDTSHRWPAFLPDGRHFLYSVSSVSEERRGVFLASLDASPSEGVRLIHSPLAAVFAPTGSPGLGLLLSAGSEQVEIRRLDLEGLSIIGDPVTLPLQAAPVTPHHAPLLSATGSVMTLVSPSIPFGAHVASSSREGAGLMIGSERELGGFFRLSPDGGRLARARLDVTAMDADVWVEDRMRGSRVRVTTSRDLDVLPVWSPDGRSLAFRTGPVPSVVLGFAAADGSGEFESLPCPGAYCEPTDWSPDGRVLVVNVGAGDVWEVPVDGVELPRPLLAEPFVQRDARFSPDGRWLAYVSYESGRPEVSVRSLAGRPRRTVVSSGGGDQPVWRRDGRELFYTDLRGQLHSVAVRTDAAEGLVFGVARRTGVPSFGERHWGTVYDVTPDGNTVYFPHPGTAVPPREIRFVLDWRELLAPGGW